jgi:Flp pilus assembly protein TadB
VIAWALSLWTGFSLRAKAFLLGAAALGLAFLLLFFRAKRAESRAEKAEEKAEKLEQTRALEQRIAAARAKTREQQDKLREQIRARKKNDYFER